MVTGAAGRAGSLEGTPPRHFLVSAIILVNRRERHAVVTGNRNVTGSRNAFTLIELLIVVTIVAVLAAVVIPQFSSSTEDASESLLQHNLRTMRAMIGVYEADHAGRYPSLARFADQMILASNTTGGTTGETPYGPYIRDEIPENPFNHSNKVAAVAAAGKRPTVVVAGGAGWQYDESNGAIWPNNREYYDLAIVAQEAEAIGP